MLDILQQMYSNVRLQVKVDNVYGPEFESSIGVKQGDPLSPLLFGLYIDRFASFLRKRCSEGDVMCGEDIVQVLLYANDLALVAHDPVKLQAYLNVLETFCQASGMNVNVAKSEVVVFFKNWTKEPYKWMFNKKQIQESKEFVYLGVHFHTSGFKTSVTKTVKRRALKARNALFGIIGTCHRLKVYDIQILNTLFNGAVVPSALYGCEIWGPDLIHSINTDLTYQPLEDTQWLFMRMALWVGKSTPHSSMLRETGRELLILKCFEQSIGFWNKLCSRPSNGNCLVTKAAKDNLLRLDNGWAKNFQAMLQMAAGLEVNLTQDGQFCRVDKRHTMGKIRAKLEAVMSMKYAACISATETSSGSLVRACPNNVRDGFKSYKYNKWFEHDENDAPIMSLVPDVGDIRTLARFRCGMHWLATEKGRSAELGRSDRLCMCCAANEREDELHLLFCDAYSHIRSQFPTVFYCDSYHTLRHAYNNNDHDLDERMSTFLNKSNYAYINDFVGFLRKSIKVRDAIVESS